MSDSVRQSVFRAADEMGVLTREFRIRVLDCSTSGCLVEANARLPVGLVGVLSLAIDGEAFEDDVQVVRCQLVEGAGALYRIGAKFLWTGMPGRRSLRRAMRREAADASGLTGLASLMSPAPSADTSSE